MEQGMYVMIIIIILCVMSLISFILFGVDKHRAAHGRWRIAEKALLLAAFFGGIGGLLGMLVFHHKTRKWKFRILVPLFAFVQLIVFVFVIWSSDYYRAGETAAAAMQTDAVVAVEKTGSGWLFDGPSEEDLLIFYPGAKVEETAYAPLLRMLAEQKMDVYLVKMPYHLAFFNINAAERVLKNSTYARYYLGGHSLGGAMAANYAAEHEDAFDAVILLAAYPTKETSLDTLLVYGSEDGVLNRDRVHAAEDLISGTCTAYVLEGGNHAQFGDYGLQSGDGTAGISAQEQQSRTVEEIIRFLDDGSG